jgi:hypothetical protein
MRLNSSRYMSGIGRVLLLAAPKFAPIQQPLCNNFSYSQSRNVIISKIIRSEAAKKTASVSELHASVCSAISRASTNSIPKYRTVLSNLV